MSTQVASQLDERPNAAIDVITDLSRDGVIEIANTLRSLLADVFTLYLKTKTFHWQINGPHFRDYHLLLDEHADQLIEMTDAIAERARKIGGATLRSIGDVSRHQRLDDNDLEGLSASQMLVALALDNVQLTRYLRVAHRTCERYDDVATAGFIENWIDQAERRTWFLSRIRAGA